VGGCVLHKEMKLITGAGGLIGSTLKGDIIINGRSDLDLRNTEETFKFFKEKSPDTVIHTAAKVGGLGANMAYMSDFYIDNVLINSNVLEASRRSGVKKLISLLSTCIFPDNVEYPLTEFKVQEGEPHDSYLDYAYAKRVLVVRCRAIFNQHGLRYQCVIPTNVYGPNDNFSLTDGHVLPSLIHKCYLAKRSNKDFVVWGTGKPLREFIYSKDVGRLVDSLLLCEHSFDSLILSNSVEMPISHVAEEISRCMGFKGSIVYDKSKPDGQHRKPTSNARLKKILPNFDFTPFEEGLSETVDWFIRNYESCRK